MQKPRIKTIDGWWRVDFDSSKPLGDQGICDVLSASYFCRKMNQDKGKFSDARSKAR